MNKFAIIVFGILSCVGYVACSSVPIAGSCQVKDFNGECCIKQSDCTQESGNSEQEAVALSKSCHDLDPERKVLLCLNDFNAANLPDCVKLKNVQEVCMGSDDVWNGRQPFSYDVWCCK